MILLCKEKYILHIYRKDDLMLHTLGVSNDNFEQYFLKFALLCQIF